MRIKKPDATLEQLGVEAGYNGSTPAQAAVRALKSPAVVIRIQDLMDKHPNLTDAGLARKMSEGLEAERTEFFTHEAVVGEEPVLDSNGEQVLDKKTGKPKMRVVRDLKIITRKTVDYAVQHKYLDTALKVKKHLVAGLDVKLPDSITTFSLSLGDRGASAPITVVATK